MKRLFAGAAIALATGGAALASDLPPPRTVPAYIPPTVAPISPYTPVSIYNWTGVFVGIHTGYGWGKSTATNAAFGTSLTAKPSGGLLGLQAGFNYQASNWVIGFGVDWAWTNANKSASIAVGGITFTGTSKVTSYGTLYSRVGYVSWDVVMLYVKGGLAWESVKYTATSLGLTSSVSDTRFGWMLGTGLEWGFAHNWSAFLEYNYLYFGSKNYTFAAVATTASIKADAHLIKLGANYRFGGPVWSRY